MHHHCDQARLASDRRVLATAAALILSFLVVELVGGILAGSLALLADAGHMLSDAAALAIALFASWLAARPATPQRSFGFRRAEILAALANGVTLVAIAIWIVVEAARRLADPPQVEGLWVLGVGGAGLAVNLAAAAVLWRAGSHSLNVRGALLHVLSDLAGSVGVVAAGVLVLSFGWQLADPAIGLLIGVLVLVSSWRLLAESVTILLEAAPAGIDAEEVGRAMASLPEVVEVHDLHIWTITPGFPALSAHVLVEPRADCHAARRRLESLLVERFGLEHTTLQVDHAGERSVTVELGPSYRRSAPLRGPSR
ncbi:MAG: cation transporter [Thermoleophilia bacterium]